MGDVGSVREVGSHVVWLGLAELVSGRWADLLAEEAVGVRVPHQVRVLLLAQVGRRAQPAVTLDVDLVRGGRRPGGGGGGERGERGVGERTDGRAGPMPSGVQRTLASSTSAPSSL